MNAAELGVYNESAELLLRCQKPAFQRRGKTARGCIQEIQENSVWKRKDNTCYDGDIPTLLRRANARPEVAQWVRKNFSCEECEASKQPQARRPAAVPSTYLVNDVVGLDFMTVPRVRFMSTVGTETHSV